MNKGKLYTSYFSKLNKGIGIKISIARINPEWLKPNSLDCWCETLAPNIKLLNDYKYKGISWEEYTERYIIDLNANNNHEFIKIKQLLDNGYDITVYCYKSKGNCHRHILGDIYRSLGYEVIEIK